MTFDQDHTHSLDGRSRPRYRLGDTINSGRSPSNVLDCEPKESNILDPEHPLPL